MANSDFNILTPNETDNEPDFLDPKEADKLPEVSSSDFSGDEAKETDIDQLNFNYQKIRNKRGRLKGFRVTQFMRLILSSGAALIVFCELIASTFKSYSISGVDIIACFTSVISLLLIVAVQILLVILLNRVIKKNKNESEKMFRLIQQMQEKSIIKFELDVLQKKAKKSSTIQGLIVGFTSVLAQILIWWGELFIFGIIVVLIINL